MRCLKPGFLSSHGIRGRSETRFDCCVSRPDPHVVTVCAQPLFGRLAGSSGYNASMGGFFALIVFTSPLFLPSRASRSQRLALAELVLVGASSVRFQLSAGRCRAVFAFPVRCETIIANSLIVSQCKFAYSIITR